MKIGHYPIPKQKVKTLAESVEKLIIFEEGYPYLERFIRGIGFDHPIPILGKLDGTFPRTGEMTPDVISDSLKICKNEGLRPTLSTLPNRPPSLCSGCPHIDTFLGIKEAISNYKESALFSDIGCYTLGFYETYEAIETCVDMGASISMAIGGAHAGLFPVIATIGDSTFAHSGMTGLLTAVNENVNINVVILDNDTVAMTGTQETQATGQNLINIVKGLGVHPEHIRAFNPLGKFHDSIVEILREEIEYEGLSVLIAKRECVHVSRKL